MMFYFEERFVITIALTVLQESQTYHQVSDC
jgi:hypothetical protein